MTPAQAVTPGKARRRRLYLALLAALLVLYALDAYLKSGDAAGLLPESATWRVEAEDLPGAWSRWQESPAYDALRGKAPGALQAVAVSIRKMTGVRPTPARLRFWLGEGVFVGGGPGGWCLSVRPGLALRVASLFAEPPLAPPAGETPSWGRYASGWRDGIFLVASSQAYLDAVLQDGQPVASGNAGADALAFRWDGEQPGALEVRIQPGLPLHVDLPQTAPPPQPRTFAAHGSKDALVSFSIHGGQVPALLQRAAETALEQESLATVWRSWTTLATGWWSAYCPIDFHVPPQTKPWALDVLAADFRPDIPNLELVFADQGDVGGLWSSRSLGPVQVHRWNAIEGGLIPIPDAARAWAVAETPDVRILTSHEHLMPAALQRSWTPDEGVAAQAAIQWKPFAQALSAFARRAAREEQFPGMNGDDVSRDLAPVLEALQSWGTLVVQLRPAGDGLRGEGFLAQATGPP